MDPRKGLGQNFLVDHTALKRIAASAGLDGSETVLEIGAGLGSLTRLLAVSANAVKAVELDGPIDELSQEDREYKPDRKESIQVNRPLRLLICLCIVIILRRPHQKQARRDKYLSSPIQIRNSCGAGANSCLGC